MCLPGYDPEFEGEAKTTPREQTVDRYAEDGRILLGNSVATDGETPDRMEHGCGRRRER
jgi:hypothetical protein